MNRRTLLRTVGAGVVGTTSGCLGGGGEVVVSVSESVEVKPGYGWVKEIPDISDPGGAVTYVARSDQRPFDVYLFESEEAYDYYDAFVKGDEPAETPGGHDAFSQAAVPKPGSDDVYEAATENESRQPIDPGGPFYFVVDHSSYRMENRVEEHDDPLTAFLDLEVVQKRVGI